MPDFDKGEKLRTDLVPLFVDSPVSAAILTMNAPDSLNPLDHEMVHLLKAAFDRCDGDDNVRVVLLTGMGRAFSAGGDLKKYLSMIKDPSEWSTYLEESRLMFETMRLHRKPVVSLVNGIAVAGGLELILCSDFAYAAESARIGDCHLRYGMMAGGGALALTPRAIGAPRARELLFSGRILTSAESLDWGLVNRVVPDDALLETGLAFAREVAQMSRLAVENTKFVVNKCIEDGLGASAATRLEIERAARYVLTSEDAAEGLLAFSEKRPPQFEGR